MKLARSKLTAQGQISVPAAVRRLLGVAPGGEIQWEVEGEAVVVRRAGQCSSEEIHRALFPDGPPPARSQRALKQGVRQYVRQRHARGRY